MLFDYSRYFLGCFFCPVVEILFFCFVFISGSRSLMSNLIHHTIDLKTIVKYVLLILIFLFLLGINIGRLANGGIYLVKEHESDAVEIQGRIEAMERLNRFSFPEIDSEYDQDNSNGVRFIINGIDCIGVTRGDLQIGDYVHVVYLPKSGYILSITECDENLLP